jgi:hypothetical protein
LKTQKYYFLYAWSLEIAKLGEMYALGKPIVLFRGQTKILPGMKMADMESVEIITRYNLFCVPILNPQFFLKKLWGRRHVIKYNTQKD